MSLWRKPGVAMRTALTSSRFRACAISETATADGIASTAFFPREMSASTTTETSAPSIRLVRRLMWSVPILPAPTTHTRRFVELDSDFILSYKPGPPDLLQLRIQQFLRSGLLHIRLRDHSNSR